MSVRLIAKPQAGNRSSSKGCKFWEGSLRVQGLGSQARKTTSTIVCASRAPHYTQCTPAERGEVSKRKLLHAPLEGEGVACFEVSTPIIVLISYSNQQKSDHFN